MAEKINLAQFDIDIDQLTKNAIEVKQRLDEVRESQKQLTKEGKTSSEGFIVNATLIAELSKEYNAQIKVLGAVSAATGKVIPLQQELDVIMKREVKTIIELRKQNADLLKTRNNVNLETAEGKKQLELINAQIDKNDAKIKANVSTREKEILSIGGYTNAIKDAIGSTGLLGQATGDINNTFNTVKNTLNSFSPVFNTIIVQYKEYTSDIVKAAAGTEGMSAAQKLLTITTNSTSSALKLFRLALISTGIGAIIVLLGSLAAYLSTTQKGIDLVSQAMAAFGAAISVVTDRLAKIGGIFLGLITGQKSLSQAWNEGKAALSGMGDEMAREIRLAIELKKAQQDLEKQEQLLAFQRSASNTKIKELNKTVEDQTKTQEERLAAAREIERIETDIAQKEQENANKQLAIALGKKELDQESLSLLKQLKEGTADYNVLLQSLGLSESTKEDVAALLDAFKKAEEAQQRSFEVRTTNQNKLNTLEQQHRAEQKKAADEATAAAQKAQEDAIKKSNEQLDLFIAQQGVKARTLAEDLNLERQVSEQRKAILKQELDAKKISQEKYNTEILNINNNLLKRQAELTADNARRELQTLADRVQREKENGSFMTQARAESLRTQEEALAAQRLAYEELRRDQGLISEQELQDARNQIVLDKEAALEEIQLGRAEAKKEERAIEMEAEIEALEERNATVFEIEGAKIAQQQEIDLEAARVKYKDSAILANAENLINTKAANQQKELSERKNEAILKSRADLLGSVAKILGEETVMGKAAAIAEASINTYTGITAALKLGWPAGPIAAAAIGAQGFAQVANISGINIGAGGNVSEGFGKIASSAPLAVETLPLDPGFATGGVINRGIPIHRSNGDNVLITAKKGEVILNEQQQMFLGRDFLSLAGVPGFATGGVVGPSNITTVQNTINTKFDQQLADSIGEAVREGSQLGTSIGAQQGIVDLSSERALSNTAIF